MNQQNIIIVVGDLGAGTNFVKNTLLLSPDVDFPWGQNLDRLSFIQRSVYPETLKHKVEDWISFEYKLRSWKHFYGTDIADNYQDIDTPAVNRISQSRKIVFISHWPDIANRLQQKHPGIKVVSLYAKTQNEINWQVSQYISKININALHNFTFPDNIELQKQKYIAQHGAEQYQRLNAQNMIEIMFQRKDTYNNPNYITLGIEQLQTDNWQQSVADQLNIQIDIGQAEKLSNIWRGLNPPYIEYWK